MSGIYGHCSIDGKMLAIEDVTRNVLQHLQGETSTQSTVHRLRKQLSTFACSCLLSQDQPLGFDLENYSRGLNHNRLVKQKGYDKEQSTPGAFSIQPKIPEILKQHKWCINVLGKVFIKSENG